MSSGAVADSGLIARVSFTCDTGTLPQYIVLAGFALHAHSSLNYTLDDKIDTLSGSWRLKNGLTVDITDNGSGIGSSTASTHATGIWDENFNGFGSTANNLKIDLLYKGQGEPPSGDTEQELKDNYFSRVRCLNHTATNGVSLVDVPAADFRIANPVGDPIANPTGQTANWRVQLGRFFGAGVDNSSGDPLKWALNDEVTVEFWDY